MLDVLCAELNNYFLKDKGKDIHFGEYTISNGSIGPLDFLQPGQFFRIVGSVFNDGVYEYPASGLKDEAFTGAVWAMAVPSPVIALADEIEKWAEANADVIDSPYSSESFGGYSYTKETASDGSSGAAWKSHFASEMNRWRKARVNR